MSGATRQLLYRLEPSATGLHSLNCCSAQTIKTFTAVQHFEAAGCLFQGSTYGWAEGAIVTVHAAGHEIALKQSEACFTGRSKKLVIIGPCAAMRSSCDVPGYQKSAKNIHKWLSLHSSFLHMRLRIVNASLHLRVATGAGARPQWQHDDLIEPHNVPWGLEASGPRVEAPARQCNRSRREGELWPHYQAKSYGI